jgi:hypothetical protein
MRVDGTSFTSTLDDPDAPDPRTSQYYECWGSRAVYLDGWKAVTDHVNQLTANERLLMTGSHNFATDRWALFDCRTDPTEQHDLATAHPDRLRALIDRWWELAEQNDVFPLDDGTVGRFAHMRVPWTAWRSTFDLRPGAKIHEVSGPNPAGGFRLVARSPEPVGSLDQAVLCEQGARWPGGPGTGRRRAALGDLRQGRPARGRRLVPPDASTAHRRWHRRTRRRDGEALGADGQPLGSATGAPGLGAGRRVLTIGYGRPSRSSTPTARRPPRPAHWSASASSSGPLPARRRGGAGPGAAPPVGARCVEHRPDVHAPVVSCCFRRDRDLHVGSHRARTLGCGSAVAVETVITTTSRPLAATICCWWTTVPPVSIEFSRVMSPAGSPLASVIVSVDTTSNPFTDRRPCRSLWTAWSRVSSVGDDDEKMLTLSAKLDPDPMFQVGRVAIAWLTVHVGPRAMVNAPPGSV